MKRLPLYQIDAFADRPFTGNPAAVMPLDRWLPDGLMQAIAPPGTPTPGLGTTMGGGPGGQQALGQALGGPTPQTSPFGGLGMASSAQRSGQPVAPTLGGL